MSAFSYMAQTAACSAASSLPAEYKLTTGILGAAGLARASLQCPAPSVLCVSAAPGDGGRSVVDRAVRQPGAWVHWHRCRAGASGIAEIARIEASVCAACETVPFRVVVIEEPQLVRAPENFAAALKRLARQYSLRLVLLLTDGQHADDTRYALNRRTRGVLGLPAVRVAAMTEQDAARLTHALWRLAFAGRSEPLHLAHTLFSVARGRIDSYIPAWKFAKQLYDVNAFVPPGALWEHVRPAEPDSSAGQLSPDWPPSWSPEAAVAIAIEQMESEEDDASGAMTGCLMSGWLDDSDR